MLTLAIMSFVGCAPDAEEAANSNGSFSGREINGTWKESKSGFVVSISGVTSSVMGTGVVTATGSAFPAAAKGGYCMKEVEYIRGGYWEAYYYNYFNDGSWRQTGVVGLAMADDGKSFKIGSAVYVKQ